MEGRKLTVGSSRGAYNPRSSRNCAICRKYRRRCDRREPSCGQCIRQGDKCPGYRDEWELVFRDQTKQTVKKHNSRAAKTIANHAVMPSRRMGPSREEMGVNYFLRHFVNGGNAHSRGCLNYIPSEYCASAEQSILLTSMAAVGLMALAKSTSDYDLAGSARSKYAEAVHMVNSALQSPARSRDDTTLMSVISLGVFEEISDYNSWILHVQGAAALLVARGIGQFSTSLSLKLFNQVRTDLITACVNEDMPVPDDILQLQEAGSAHPDASGSFWRIGMLGVRCAQLLTKFKGYSIGLATHLLVELNLLQDDFVTAGQRLMLEEPYSTMHVVNGHPDLVCGGKIGVYSDVWSIRIWNNWRNLLMIVCRIKCFLLDEVLKHELGLVSADHLKLERHRTLQLLSQLGEDILATAPQVTSFQVGPSPGKGEQDVAPALSHVAGAYLLAGRLSIVGQSETTSRETRQWIIKRLQYISDTARIPTAVRIIQDIETAEAQ